MKTGRMKRIGKTLYGTRGFTLVELIVVIVLVGLVLSCLYLFFNFTLKSWNQTRAATGMLQDSSLFLNRMEKEFRQAQNPAGKAVVISGSGSQVVIYTYDDKAPLLVSYRVNGGAMQRTQSHNITSDPITWVWETVIPQVMQNGSTPYFEITDTKKIVMTFLVTDPEGSVDTPIEITNTFTVRSKGAM